MGASDDGLLAGTSWRHVHRASIGSTNACALDHLARGEAVPFVVTADQQTQGRGRGGKAFASPRGGLYASLAFPARDADLPGPVVAAVALAAAEGIQAVAAVPCRIKWPNDLMVRSRKAGGILLERARDGGAVVAGIGVNLVAVPTDLPVATHRRTTALEQESGRKIQPLRLLAAIVGGVERHMGELELASGRLGLEAAWKARLTLLGERIRYLLGTERREGVLEDVDLDRGLLVREGSVAHWRRTEHVADVRAHDEMDED